MIDVRTQLRALIERTEMAALPELVAELEGAKALAWMRLASCSSSNEPVEQEAERLVAAREMAHRLSLPEHWVRDRARRGHIPAVKVGHYTRFDPPAVIAAVKAMGGGAGNGADPRSAYPVRLTAPAKLGGNCPPVSKRARGGSTPRAAGEGAPQG